jgi:L-ascorbate metabolism protein UlaG (beta-lactamase superfamily)
MKLTKINHSTILLNHKDTNILFDPGDYSIEQVKSLSGLNLLIITHTHADHLHIDSVKAIIQNNPSIKILTNSEVKSLLDNEGIESEVCENGQTTTFNNISIRSFDFPHVEIWKEMKHPQNTAYLIDDVFYNPADSFGVIDEKVKVCALMITSPGSKISEALEFAIAQKPEIAIGVHDGMLNRITGSHKVPEMVLPQQGINYQNLEIGKEYTF